MTIVATLKERARHLKSETLALYLAARDPRTPWYAKLLVAAIVAYALSPIDLIPPVKGQPLVISNLDLIIWLWMRDRTAWLEN